MNFAEEIKRLRTERKLTQARMAELLHVSRQTISSWENGRNLPDLEMTVRIAKTFGVSLDSLILGGSEMEQKLIRDGSETRRTKMTMIAAIVGAVLLCIGAGCIILKGLTVEYIDAAGVLHENFFLLPIGFLFLFSGLTVFLALGVKGVVRAVCRRFGKNRE